LILLDQLIEEIGVAALEPLGEGLVVVGHLGGEEKNRPEWCRGQSCKCRAHSTGYTGRRGKKTQGWDAGQVAGISAVTGYKLGVVSGRNDRGRQRRVLPHPDKLFNAGLGGSQGRALDLFDGDKLNARVLKTNDASAFKRAACLKSAKPLRARKSGNGRDAPEQFVATPSHQTPNFPPTASIHSTSASHVRMIYTQ
jgi:hypothetical protein